MPILVEPESNPRWGFLHGFGATTSGATPAAKQIAEINEAQGKLAAQISLIDSEAARLRRNPITGVSAVGPDMVEKAKAFKAAVERVANLIEENVDFRGLASGSLLRQLQLKVAEARQKGVSYLEIAEEFKRTGKIGALSSSGGRVTVNYGISQVMGNVVQTYSDMARDLDGLLVDQSYSVSGGYIWNLLPTTLAENVVLPLAAIVKKVLNAAIDILNGAADALALAGRTIRKLPEAGNWLLDNWPIVAGIAAVVIFGPSLWRIYKAGKTGGYMAAGDAAAGALESGRASIASGARSAAAAARKAAMAYGTGGASLALQGSPRLRRRR